MKIMLACNAGMSTSLVVAKMEEAAKAQGKDYKIWAVDSGSVESELGNFDVLLLGPQISYQLRKITKLVDGKAPVATINPVDYGKCDGAAVLKSAEELFQKFN
ncbi:PTS sugar transporter subunit IIB [Neobacillus dielmonensis]|uniref:PTS sugar transporter subunit IIB n=1 Tax=Neobacillus dielmonensis TaxID=1347369 RepID=UPI0005A64BE4|nr:PTS sugar transporter subunit IIB [Neobacillus dielmonensis]